MKIIDDMGRLFGKVNVIDFLVVVFLLCFIPAFYLGYKMITTKPAVPEEKEYVETEIQCNLIKIKPEVLGLIAVGDKEIDEQGNQIAQITWLGESKPYIYKIDMGDNEIKNIKNISLVELPAKIRLKAEVIKTKLYYKNVPISFGSVFDFKTNKYTVKTMPVNIKKEKWVQIKVKFSGMTPELSNMLNKGHTEKDTEGRIVGVLKEVISNKPSEISVMKLEENRIFFVNDPTRNDVIILLDILCMEKDGVLYFKNYPVKAGGQIGFMSDLYIVSGTIIGINYNAD